MSKSKLIDERKLSRNLLGYRVIEEAEFGDVRFPLNMPGLTPGPYPFNGPLISPIPKSVTDGEIGYSSERTHIPTSHMLHRKFAALSADPDVILTFANQYGTLGRIIVWSDHHNSCEFISEWVAEIERLQVLIDIYDGTLAKRRLGIDDETKVLSLLRRKRILDNFTAIIDTDNLIRNSRNIWLMASRPKLYWYILSVEIERELALGVGVTFRELKPGATLALHPEDLLAAIYVHFLNEIIGSIRTPIKCTGCGKWFSPKDARSKYCSNACKVRQYRARKREETNGN